MVEWVNKFGPAKILFDFFLGGVFFWGWGSKSLDLNIATNKRYGDSRLVAKSPFSKKATVYLATVTIATVANYTLPKVVFDAFPKFLIKTEVDEVVQGVYPQTLQIQITTQWNGSC